MESKVKLAYDMLCALRYSSFADEMQHYSKAVREELNLTHEQMALFDFETICTLLRPSTQPVRTFRGRPLSSSPVQETSYYCSGGVCQLLSSDQTGLPTQAGLSTYTDLPFLVEPLPTVTEETPGKEDVTSEDPHGREDSTLAQGDSNDPSPREVSALAQDGSASAQGVPKTPSSNKHPAARAMRKICRAAGLPVEDFQFDTDKYPKALVLHGNTKPHQAILEKLGGRWNGRLGGVVFAKAKIMEAVVEATKTTEEKQ